MVVEINKPTQANGSMDYEDMTKTIKYLLDAAWGPKWGSFIPDGPNVTDDKHVEYPIIVHYLSVMQPGLIGKTPEKSNLVNVTLLLMKILMELYHLQLRFMVRYLMQRLF